MGVLNSVACVLKVDHSLYSRVQKLEAVTISAMVYTVWETKNRE